jgi:hypothetical protein
MNRRKVALRMKLERDINTTMIYTATRPPSTEREWVESATEIS